MKTELKRTGGAVFFVHDRGNSSLELALLKAIRRSVDLRNTDLSGVDLGYSDLSGVDFSGSDFSSSIFSYADLTGANLSCVDLRGTVLDGAYLGGAILDRGEKLIHGRPRGPILQLGPLGARDVYLFVYFTNAGVRVRIRDEDGYWFGTAPAFEALVLAKPDDFDYVVEYRAALEALKEHVNVEGVQ